MKQTLEGVLKYLRKNYCSYWIILGIDTAIAVPLYMDSLHRYL